MARIRQQSLFSTLWSLVLFACAQYNIIVIPLRIGFLVMDGTSWIPSDLIADVLYAADIVIRFLTTFDEGEGGQIDDLSQIAKRYVTGNFAFDVVSVLPLELLSFAIGGYHPGLRFHSSFTHNFPPNYIDLNVRRSEQTVQTHR